MPDVLWFLIRVLVKYSEVTGNCCPGEHQHRLPGREQVPAEHSPCHYKSWLLQQGKEFYKNWLLQQSTEFYKSCLLQQDIEFYKTLVITIRYKVL